MTHSILNKAVIHLTGKDAYENTDPDAYKALVAELKKGITYGEGIGRRGGFQTVDSYLSVRRRLAGVI